MRVEVEHLEGAQFYPRQAVFKVEGTAEEIGDFVRQLEADTKVDQPTTKEEPKRHKGYAVGDIIVVTKDNHEHKAGKVARIAELNTLAFDFRIETLNGYPDGYISAENIREAMPEDIEDPKVGDYVVGIDHADNPHHATHPDKMKLGKVTRDSRYGESDRFHVTPVVTSGKDLREKHVLREFFRKATAEEVNLHLKGKVFCDIGREPYEFKAGDIVMVEGALNEVADSMSGVILKHRHNGLTWWPKSNVTLVTPVENRLDKQ